MGDSKISEAKFRQLVRCFALDFTAMSTAELTDLSVRSVNSIFLKIRGRIAESCELDSPLQGAVEVDESYFGAHRVRGRRGRGALAGGEGLQRQGVGRRERNRRAEEFLDLPPLREILEHEKTALLLEPDRVEAWVAAIERLQHDRALAARLASGAKALASRFSWRERSFIAWVGLRGAVPLCHHFLAAVVGPGDRVVDATCGNGHEPSEGQKFSGECGAPAPACRIRTGRSAPSSSWGRRVLGRPSWPGHWQSSCSTTSGRWSAWT